MLTCAETIAVMARCRLTLVRAGREPTGPMARSRYDNVGDEDDFEILRVVARGANWTLVTQSARVQATRGLRPLLLGRDPRRSEWKGQCFDDPADTSARRQRGPESCDLPIYSPRCCYVRFNGLRLAIAAIGSAASIGLEMCI